MEPTARLRRETGDSFLHRLWRVSCFSLMALVFLFFFLSFSVPSVPVQMNGSTSVSSALAGTNPDPDESLGSKTPLIPVTKLLCHAGLQYQSVRTDVILL